MHIVLVEPEIPGNTGNIARLCAATGLALHLVRPLGFSTDDKYLKRAGLDYWHLVQIFYHDSIEELFEADADASYYFFSTKADRIYTEISFTQDDYLVFGKETAGLPEDLLHAHWDTTVKIPMRSEARSLNLSNAVAIASYEALRQLSFPSLQA
ncbi:MAG: tRNA (uridine(34)/cytosine(34)/5-carboxymethylaminomethyluridine(34)-2'-O)-methyltransferase TrmL [Schwartzia sp.]|nr:tRNA (uridine(34)/cytosine(34)/5-carboxymethylaminomethyluridine(34)-2'-O)-methyltransferase TrmL [Schwartzia sp. (in: firmicutes)]